MKVIGTDGKEYTIEPRAELREANLEDADLRWASLRGVNLYRANLSGTDLSRVNLMDTNLSNADLSNANLEGALYTDGTKFPEGFDPVDSGMHWIEPNADLSKANLRGANLVHADLSEVDLYKANLRGAKLSEAVWNGDTVFPEGFEIPEGSQA